MRKNVFLALIACCCLLASVAHAAAHDYIVERAYFEDASNALTLDQVKEKPFATFSGMLSKGYSQSAFWVRLKIASVGQEGHGSPLVLKIQPTYLDEIRLYDSAEPLRLDRSLGDHSPYANNERNSLTYDFLIPASEKERYVWLRLKTSSTNLMQLLVVSEADALMLDRQLDMVSSAIFSALAIFLLWASMHWWATRERLVGIFIIRQLFGIAFFAAYIGYFRILLSDVVSPAFLDLTLSFFVVSSTTVAIWFHGEFFKEYLISPRLQAIFKFTVALFPLEMLLFAMGKVSAALAINMLVVLVLPWVMFFISLFAVPWKKLGNSVYVLPRRYLILAHGMYLFVTSLTTLPSLGLASGGIFSPHAVLLHALVTAMVLLSMIYYRSKRIEEKRISDVVVAEQTALAEKTKREEQARFLEMLTHEIKTSLAVLKMALGSVNLASKEGKYANSAVDSMNEVIERCAQVQALSDDQVQVKLNEVNLVELLDLVIAGTRSPERIKLSFDQSVTVRSDEKLFRVILSNLIDNALKYSKPQSMVNVHVKVIGQDVTVIVSNEVGSAGMPDKARVFSKYYRSERAHEQIGSGLGLYLTWQFANMLGMKLSYEPKHGPKAEMVEFELCLKQSV